MGFCDISKIEDFQFYLDKAISRAQKRAEIVREIKSKEDRVVKSRRIEVLKINIIADVLCDDLNKIVCRFPMVEELNEFYKELVKISLDYGLLKKSMGALNWAVKKITEFKRVYSRKIQNSKRSFDMNKHRKEYYGRISSLLKQIKTDFINIDNARRELRKFPVVKTKLRTIAIAGFPNVGKTTLLSKVTGAKAEIKNYAFTTKGINMGYYDDGKKRIQFVDTPGTLNRFSTMNVHEKQAYLALKHLADVIVYVFDPTEASYPLDMQKKLYTEVEKFGKKMYIYIAKQDMLKDKKILKELENYQVATLTSLPDL